MFITTLTEAHNYPEPNEASSINGGQFDYLTILLASEGLRLDV